jgi:hypothetical protein
LNPCGICGSGTEAEDKSTEDKGLQVIEPHSHDRDEFVTTIAFLILPQDVFDALHEGYEAHKETGDSVERGSEGPYEIRADAAE